MIADQLLALRADGVLVLAAERGLITELACTFEDCDCPEGRDYFERRGGRRLWAPSADRYPTPGRDGGEYTAENVRLMHYRCNQRDGGRVGGRRATERLTEEQLSERGRQGASSLTNEQRSALGRAGGAAHTREQYAAAGRIGGRKGGPIGGAVTTSRYGGWAWTTRESRSRGGKTTNANLTREQRSLIGKAGARALTREQRTKAGVSSQAKRSPELKTRVGRRGMHSRWHARRGIKNESCIWCQSQ